jgi:hypothetical protein
VIPYGVWMAVADPCPGCGKRYAGGARRKVAGRRVTDGSWFFWVVWEYTCRVCGLCEIGNG